jgi:hypothetical protein
MAEAADIVMKRHDTSEPLKATLRRKNPSTGEWEPIDLATALKVTLLLKGERVTLAMERPCTAWGGAPITTSTGAAAGQVEYAWGQTDLEPAVVPELFKMEWEIESPITAGVKRFQTVPNNKYRTLEVIADLGVA